MAQEGIATLPQSPENAQMQTFSGALDLTKNAVTQQVGPEEMGGYEQTMDQMVSSLNLPEEELQTLMEVLQYLLQNEQQYPQLRQRLIQEAGLDPEDIPEEFDRGYLTTMMIVVQEALNRAQGNGAQMPQPQGFQKGGLAGAAEALRQRGRGGDTILAHINPQEARMLKSMGGAGTINPATGIMEFKGGGGGVLGGIGKAVGGAFKAVGNAVKSIVSSPVGKIVATVALTAALGPAGLAIAGPASAGFFALAIPAAIAGSAVSLAGGSNLKQALISGVTSGAMAGFAPQISSMLPGAGGYLNAAATGAIMGAGYGAATGQNIGQAALTGGVLAGGMSAFGGANATGPGSGTGLFSSQPSTEAPIVDKSTVLPGPSDGISTLPTGNTNLTAPTDAVGSYGPDTGFATPPAPSSSAAGGYGPDTGFPPQTRGSELIPGNVNTEVTYTDKRLPLPNARDVESQAGGFYGGRAPTAEEYMVTQQGMPRSVPQSESTGIGGFYDKAKDYLFSSDPSNPGFFYNSKGEISMPAVTGTVLAGGALMGGFTPTQPAPPGIVDRSVTGETLVDRDPSRYIVGDIPNFNTTQPNMPPVTYTAAPQYGRSAVPTYTPPAGTTTATNYQPIQQPYNNPYNYSFMPRVYAAKGGITSIYPRKTGKIDGPGTGTSDSIPAMLSDGEFVLTAKAVKGAGKGSRREGAKKLYRMMHALEKKAGGRV
jgi:hypothetical protein